jgi:hypothetical protein
MPRLLPSVLALFMLPLRAQPLPEPPPPPPEAAGPKGSELMPALTLATYRRCCGDRARCRHCA